MSNKQELYKKIKDEKLTNSELLCLAETIVLDVAIRLKSEKLYDVYSDINNIRSFWQEVLSNGEVGET
jgi:hypothetical protein